MTIRFSVNGSARETDASPEKPLLWVLRDELRLTGTQNGYGIAQWGACIVLVDGLAQQSCVLPIQKDTPARNASSGNLAGAIVDCKRALSLQAEALTPALMPAILRTWE